MSINCHVRLEVRQTLVQLACCLAIALAMGGIIFSMQLSTLCTGYVLSQQEKT